MFVLPNSKSPSPFPSPQWGEGWGEGLLEIGVWDLFGI
jgi:hypothetical protein